jgi:signal peptide peptidase SppA
MNKEILTEFANSLWAMDPQKIGDFFLKISELPDVTFLQDIQVAKPAPGLTKRGTTAIIKILGPLMSTVPNWLRFWGIQATGYDEIISQVSAAMADNTVERIELEINSPGGSVGGLAIVAELIYEARKQKPTNATIFDLGASAAYWLASQASVITAADRNTIVGSIGVYSVYYDFSGYFEQQGIRPVVIRSGAIKGMGLDKISDEQIASVQEMIDEMSANFIDDVTKGRATERDKIAELATGQAWAAGTARDLGLIDNVYETESGADDGAQTTGTGANEMKEEKTAENAVDLDKVRADEKVRLEQIKEAVKGDLDFAVDAWQRGLTPTEAKAEYADVLMAKLAEKEQAGDKSGTESEGAPFVPSGDSDGANSADGFMAEARELSEDKSISMTEAMRIVKRRNPDAYNHFIEQSDAKGRAIYDEAEAMLVG